MGANVCAMNKKKERLFSLLGTRGRGEVLGQAGVVEACAYIPKVTPRGKIRFLI